MGYDRTRPAHQPDPLCALEAAAVAARHARNAALGALAQHPTPGSFDYIAQAADLPFGFVTRGPLTVSAIESVVRTARGPAPMLFHYHHLAVPVTRETAVGLLRRHIAQAAQAPAERAHA